MMLLLWVGGGPSRSHTCQLQRQLIRKSAWGSYLLVEQAIDAARKTGREPQFRRWDGCGAIGVQVQKRRDHYLPADALLEGSDTRLQIDTTPQTVPGRNGQPRPRIRIRIGSDGRAPVWGEWPLIFHRPLPPGSEVTWARVVRRRVASHHRWELHLTVRLPDEWRLEECGSGVVAVDLGWRRAAGTLRAGGWIGDDGRGGEIMVEPGVRGELRRVEDLRSIRDKNRNEMQARLSARLRDHNLPPEMFERTERLAMWKSPDRFAALALWWRENRFSGDLEAYELIESWRKRDKHLWEWEANARRGALARRLDQYRNFAALIAREFDTLVIERLDLAAMASVPAPESERESNRRERGQRFETAPSELRSALIQAFEARGGRVMTVPPAGPAGELLREYREGSGVEEAPGTSREPKWARLKREKAERGVASGIEHT